MDYVYSFNPQKNKKLIEERGISFEEIISILEGEGPLDVVNHPNTRKYSHQKMFVIEIRDYMYLVPFVEEKNKRFLKTAFPSRKATKIYLNEWGKGLWKKENNLFLI